MINHDAIYKKEVIRDEFIAVTDVAVVKYEKPIFIQIIEQFPDVEEDVRAMMNDRDAIVGHAEYINAAVKDDSIRKQIVDEYYAVLNEETEEAKRKKRMYKSVPDDNNPILLHEEVRKAAGKVPKVTFKTVAEKKTSRKKMNNGDDILDDSASFLSEDLDSEDQDE